MNKRNRVRPAIQSIGFILTKKNVFATILVCCSILAALVLCEFVLRYQEQPEQKIDLLDHGLINYDRKLGWKLTPRWHGNHRHHDFKVSYNTNQYGFRGKFTNPGGPDGRHIAFLGDSFTFGFGVNDHETFVHKLSIKEPGNRYLNFAVPGFSTDQQYILLRERVFDFSPDVVVLITYLGNDLFDNLLPFPLQANHGKPYFELFENRLVLQNSPVPLAVKSKEQAAVDLNSVVMGNPPPDRGRFLHTLNKSELFQRVKRALRSDKKNLFPFFDAQFEQALKVYTALLKQMVVLCESNRAKLIVALMPGRSLIERPGSQSAQFQEYLREKIIEKCNNLRIPLIDLALPLKTVHNETGEKLFYPNEGHMNAKGHQITAETLHKQIKSQSSEDP